MGEDKLSNTFYSKYVGKYAKRFYTPFEEDNIFRIIAFVLIYNDFLKKDVAFFTMSNFENIWNWDVEDCIIITDEMPLEDERVISIHDKNYKGFNPYTK